MSSICSQGYPEFRDCICKPKLLMLITPIIVWTIYWLWRLGKVQLQRGG